MDLFIGRKNNSPTLDVICLPQKNATARSFNFKGHLRARNLWREFLDSLRRSSCLSQSHLEHFLVSLTGLDFDFGGILSYKRSKSTLLVRESAKAVASCGKKKKTGSCDRMCYLIS